MDYDPNELLREVDFEIEVPTERPSDLITINAFTGILELATHVASAEIMVVFDTHDTAIQVQGQALVNHVGNTWRHLTLKLGEELDSSEFPDFDSDRKVFISNISTGQAFTCRPNVEVHAISYGSPFKIFGKGPLVIIAIIAAYGGGSFELEWRNDLTIKVEYQGNLAESTRETQRTFADARRVNRLTVRSADRVSNRLTERERANER